MINSVYVASQTVTAGSNVLFLTDRVKTKSCQCAINGWLYHEPGSGQFLISKPGYYKVYYDADITSASTGTVTLDIEMNGEAVTGSTSTYTVGIANTVGHLGSESLIYVPCGVSATITIGNNSALDEIITNASIIITRLA